MLSTSTILLVFSALPGFAAAHSVPHGSRKEEKRDAAAFTTVIATTPAPNSWYTIPPLAQITESPSIQPSQALFSTVASGAPAPIASAPANPGFVFSPTLGYPTLDEIPPTNSSEVQAWLAELDLSSVPNLNVTTGACATSPEAAADTSRCWWTCGGCSRDTDITSCPDKLTWGVSYDDGPSPFTPLLLDVLTEADILATFFVVGSRVISYPETLSLEYALGHQLSIHTWSHPPLTMLTNEQIVAEIGWTRKAIKAVTGVSPNTMRPPYGDIDDRVRGVLKAMGVTPIIWTTAPDGTTFDTNDWKINGGGATGESSVAAFNKILEDVPNLDTGFIVLEHDLWQQTVDLSVGYFLPSVLATKNATGLKLTNIIDCHHQVPGNAYVETYINSTTSTNTSSSSSSASSSIKGTSVAATGSAASASATSAAGGSSSKTTTTSGGSRSAVAGVFLAGAAAVAALTSF